MRIIFLLPSKQNIFFPDDGAALNQSIFCAKDFSPKHIGCFPPCVFLCSINMVIFFLNLNSSRVFCVHCERNFSSSALENIEIRNEKRHRSAWEGNAATPPGITMEIQGLKM